MQTVEVQTADGTADAYLVKPAGDGPFPGVLVYMDAFGLRPRIAEMATRIAERGYAVLAPNLLYRHARPPLVDPAEIADPERRGAAFGRIVPMIMQLTPERMAADTTAYLDFLAAQDGVAAGPAAVVGYCMGGTNALVAISAHPDRLAAAAVFHGGRIVTDQPDSPHLGVAGITGEVYFGHADNDPSMSAEQIKTLEAALDAAGVTYTSEVYEGAPHGFTMSDTWVYDEQAEQRHWTTLFAYLERVLPAR